MRYTGRVETRVLPSPVFISAIQPKCRAAPPISWTSKWRWPMVRLAASRTVAKASTSRSLSSSPAVQALPELDRPVGERLVAQGLDLGLELVDVRHQAPAGPGPSCPRRRAGSWRRHSWPTHGTGGPAAPGPRPRARLPSRACRGSTDSRVADCRARAGRSGPGRPPAACPTCPVAVLIGAYACWFGLLSVAGARRLRHPRLRHGHLRPGRLAASRFHAPFVTVMGRNLFGDHTSFILLLAVPIYWVWPHAQALLVLQTCLLAAAAVPIYLLARRRTSSAVIATALAGAYLLNPALQNGNLEQFHPECFLVLSVAVAIYAAVESKPVLLGGGGRRLPAGQGGRRPADGPLWRCGSTSGGTAGGGQDRRRGRGLDGRRLRGGDQLPARHHLLLRQPDPVRRVRWPGHAPFAHPVRFWRYVRSDGRLFYLWQMGAVVRVRLRCIAPEVAAIGILLPVGENVLSLFPYMHQILYHYSMPLRPGAGARHRVRRRRPRRPGPSVPGHRAGPAGRASRRASSGGWRRSPTRATRTVSPEQPAGAGHQLGPASRSRRTRWCPPTTRTSPIWTTAPASTSGPRRSRPSTGACTAKRVSACRSRATVQYVVLPRRPVPRRRRHLAVGRVGSS